MGHAVHHGVLAERGVPWMPCLYPYWMPCLYPYWMPCLYPYWTPCLYPYWDLMPVPVLGSHACTRTGAWSGHRGLVWSSRPGHGRLAWSWSSGLDHGRLAWIDVVIGLRLTVIDCSVRFHMLGCSSGLKCMAAQGSEAGRTKDLRLPHQEPEAKSQIVLS